MLAGLVVIPVPRVVTPVLLSGVVSAVEVIVAGPVAVAGRPVGSVVEALPSAHIDYIILSMIVVVSKGSSVWG